MTPDEIHAAYATIFLQLNAKKFRQRHQAAQLMLRGIIDHHVGLVRQLDYLAGQQKGVSTVSDVAAAHMTGTVLVTALEESDEGSDDLKACAAELRALVETWGQRCGVKPV